MAPYARFVLQPRTELLTRPATLYVRNRLLLPLSLCFALFYWGWTPPPRYMPDGQDTGCINVSGGLPPPARRTHFVRSCCL